MSRTMIVVLCLLAGWYLFTHADVCAEATDGVHLICEKAGVVLK